MATVQKTSRQNPLAPVILLVLSACCQNSALTRVPSPNGQTQAVVFERDCGAPGDVGYHISIVRAGVDVPEGTGNAFRFIDTARYARLVNSLGIQWRSDADLLIRYDSRAIVVKQAAHVRGVHVSYEPTRP